MALENYTGDYDWSAYTPLDSTGTNYDIFSSAYKNVRFNVQVQTQYTIKTKDIANFPGLAYTLYGDTSLWRALLAYNGLSDPISDLAIGMVINIPAKASLSAYLSQQSTNKQVTINI